MTDHHDNHSHINLSPTGLDLKCHCCGDSLPLLHPHIMVERYDPDDNIICEACYERQCADGKDHLSGESKDHAG